MIETQPKETIFKAFFPHLTEQNWKDELSIKNFSQSIMPYQLKIENVSAYLQECHFCETNTCRQNCPLPYSDEITVLDILQKAGVSDNVSMY